MEGTQISEGPEIVRAVGNSFDTYVYITTVDCTGQTVQEFKFKLRCPDLLEFIKRFSNLYDEFHPNKSGAMSQTVVMSEEDS